MLLHLLVAVIAKSITCTIILVDDGLEIFTVNITDPILSVKILDTSVNPTTTAENVNGKYTQVILKCVLYDNIYYINSVHLLSLSSIVTVDWSG